MNGYILYGIWNSSSTATYYECQKLSKRKVSQLPGFHPNIQKTLVIFASSVLEILPLLKAFAGKTFAIHQKSAKITKIFSGVAFVVYST